jgi:ribosomal protein L4
MAAESVRVNGRNADQKRQRNGADSNASDQPFGETKPPAQKTINCGAD